MRPATGILVAMLLTGLPSRATAEEPAILMRLEYTLAAPEWFGPTIFVDALVFRDGSVFHSTFTSSSSGSLTRSPLLATEFAQLRSSLSENRVARRRPACGKLVLPVAHLYDVTEGRLSFYRLNGTINTLHFGDAGPLCEPSVQELVVASFQYIHQASAAGGEQVSLPPQ